MKSLLIYLGSAITMVVGSLATNATAFEAELQPSVVTTSQRQYSTDLLYAFGSTSLVGELQCFGSSNGEPPEPIAGCEVTFSWSVARGSGGLSDRFYASRPPGILYGTNTGSDDFETVEYIQSNKTCEGGHQVGTGGSSSASTKCITLENGTIDWAWLMPESVGELSLEGCVVYPPGFSAPPKAAPVPGAGEVTPVVAQDLGNIIYGETKHVGCAQSAKCDLNDMASEVQIELEPLSTTQKDGRQRSCFTGEVSLRIPLTFVPLNTPQKPNIADPDTAIHGANAQGYSLSLHRDRLYFADTLLREQLRAAGSATSIDDRGGLYVTGSTLKNGGLFDFSPHSPWHPPHRRHRLGEASDIAWIHKWSSIIDPSEADNIIARRTMQCNALEAAGFSFPAGGEQCPRDINNGNSTHIHAEFPNVAASQAAELATEVEQ